MINDAHIRRLHAKVNIVLKVKEQFAHVPEGLRLKRVELNRVMTRVHNFFEFIASGRATPAFSATRSRKPSSR